MYRTTMDQTLSYMQSLNLPKDLQDKIRMWFNYNWEHQKTLSKSKTDHYYNALQANQFIFSATMMFNFPTLNLSIA